MLLIISNKFMIWDLGNDINFTVSMTLLWAVIHLMSTCV